MTEQEWRRKADRLRAELKVARRGVYYGQPDEGKEQNHKALRDAEDALRLHLDNKSDLVV